MDKELIEQISQLRAQYHRSQDPKTAAEIKRLSNQLSSYLSNGAKPCDCGGIVHGMLRREIPVDGLKMRIYEVGCLSCSISDKPKAAWGQSPQEAVSNWNAGKYIPAKKGPTLTVIKNG